VELGFSRRVGRRDIVELNMMKPLSVAVGLFAMIALPALAETNNPSQATGPSAQSSGVGIPGQPGNKSGPAVRPPQGSSGATASTDQTNPSTRLQDPSKIEGKPGNKSGSPAKR
jgi:hypothetical protein